MHPRLCSLSPSIRGGGSHGLTLFAPSYLEAFLCVLLGEGVVCWVWAAGAHKLFLSQRPEGTATGVLL